MEKRKAESGQELVGWRAERGEGGGQESEARGQESEVGGHFVVRHLSFIIRLLAAVLAAWAVAETALHLAVSEKTLALARRFLVLPKERGDFEYLAAEPIWAGVKLRVLLDPVELAGDNRELVTWPVEEGMYREDVLEARIEKAESGKRKAESGNGGAGI